MPLVNSYGVELMDFSLLELLQIVRRTIKTRWTLQFFESSETKHCLSKCFVNSFPRLRDFACANNFGVPVWETNFLNNDLVKTFDYF